MRTGDDEQQGGAADQGPVSNFETNAGLFRSGARGPTAGGRWAGAPPHAAMKKRVLDIEDVLWWAYRDELPKGLRGEGGGEPAAVSPMFRMGVFGARIDNWSREPGFPLACGTPHPDALLIDEAVQRLARFADQAIAEDDLDLLPDMPNFGVDEAKAMGKALVGAVATVMQSARGGKRPFWTRKTAFSAMRQPNGRASVMCWQTYTTATLERGRTASYEALVPVEILRKASYPTGAHSPLRYDPPPAEIADERAEYAVWWSCLNTLAEDLSGRLASIAVLPPSAAQRPWAEDRDLAKPPRIFADLSASVYGRHQRETAAAHRSLSQRRPIGPRGGDAAARFAPKRLKVARAG